MFDTVGDGNDTVTRQRPHAPRPRVPARLPVPARARALAGEGAVGRRAQPAAAGAAVHAAGQRAGARRADQRSRSRDAGAARGAARRAGRARCCSSATIARSSTTSSPARSCSKATAACSEYVGGYEDWLRQRAEPPEAGRGRPGAVMVESRAVWKRSPPRLHGRGNTDHAVEEAVVQGAARVRGPRRRGSKRSKTSSDGSKLPSRTRRSTKIRPRRSHRRWRGSPSCSGRCPTRYARWDELDSRNV